MSKTKSTSEGQAKPQRSWRVRWSLRVMIGLVTIVCAASAWMAYHYRVGLLHEDIGQKIAANGGTIHWTRWHYVRLNEGQPLKGKDDWIAALGLEPMFQRIASINLSNEISVDQMQAIVDQMNRLEQLDQLFIYRGFDHDGAHITKAQLASLLSNVEIKRLDISNCHLEDGPFPELRGSSIERLTLSDNPVGDRIVEELPDTIDTLILDDTLITDAGLAKLSRLKRLEFLYLQNTITSRAAVDQLRRELPNCVVFWIERKEQP